MIVCKQKLCLLVLIMRLAITQGVIKVTLVDGAQKKPAPLQSHKIYLRQ